MSVIEETIASQSGVTPAWLSPELVELQSEPIPAVPPDTSTAPVAETVPPPPQTPWYRRIPKVHMIAGAVTATALILVGATGLYLQHHSFVLVQVASLEPTYSVESPELKTELTHAASSYRLSLQTPDGKHTTYTLAQMGLTPDIPATLAAAKGQHGVAIWHITRIPLKLKTDQAAYVAFLRAHTVQATVAATDASLSLADGKVAITPEAAGQGYRVTNAPATVLAAARSLNPTALKLTRGAITPYIKAAALQPDQTLLDKVLTQQIDITIAGDVVHPAASDIASWLTLTPDYAKGTVNITVNHDAIQQYIDGLSVAYTKAPADSVTPTGGDGTVTIVEARGGGTVQDEAGLVANLSDHLLGGQGQKLAVTITGNNSRTVTAYAQPKWLLVNLVTHRMYAYEDTTLIRTFLISAGAYATPTVQGTYKIYAKYASQDMHGANADGTNYFQPNVQYINYFYKDYAVHGNYWRPLSYFGNINSSHGCVGIVNSDARWIYSWAPIGTTVMVHA